MTRHRRFPHLLEYLAHVGESSTLAHRAVPTAMKAKTSASISECRKSWINYPLSNQNCSQTVLLHMNHTTSRIRWWWCRWGPNTSSSRWKQITPLWGSSSKWAGTRDPDDAQYRHNGPKLTRSWESTSWNRCKGTPGKVRSICSSQRRGSCWPRGNGGPWQRRTYRTSYSGGCVQAWFHYNARNVFTKTASAHQTSCAETSAQFWLVVISLRTFHSWDFADY